MRLLFFGASIGLSSEDVTACELCLSALSCSVASAGDGEAEFIFATEGGGEDEMPELTWFLRGGSGAMSWVASD